MSGAKLIKLQKTSNEFEETESYRYTTPNRTHITISNNLSDNKVSDPTPKFLKE
jgi:hypothetical protein